MIDLHTHSNFSDGTDSPERLADLAASAGCAAFALTDHDGVDGLARCHEAAQAKGVELVPGCEISCSGPSGSMHVLVYFVGEEDGPMQQALLGLQKSREHRNQVMIDQLARLGLSVTYEEVLEEAGGHGVGRPHVAAVLVRKGTVATMDEAFDQWLSPGRPGYVEKQRLGPDEATRLAHSSGGVAVLAHPLSLGLSASELERVVAELSGLGLDGLEAIYAGYSPDQRHHLEDMARRQGLAVTGGSDYHGRYKPGLELGSGRGDLMVPDQLLSSLRDRIPA